MGRRVRPLPKGGMLGGGGASAEGVGPLTLACPPSKV